MGSMTSCNQGRTAGRLLLGITLATALNSVAIAADPACPQSEGPLVRWVYDAETAIRLAKALVEGRGDFEPYRDRPLVADLRGDTWVVHTVRPPCPPMQHQDGAIVVCGHGDHTAVVEITVWGKIESIHFNR